MVRAHGHSAAACREAVHAPRACGRVVGTHAFALCGTCADLDDSCPHGVQSTNAGEAGCALTPLDGSAPAGAADEIVLAKEVTLVLKAAGTVEEYEAKADAVTANLRQELRCFSYPNPNPNPHPHPCLLYTSPSPRDQRGSRMPSSA